MQRVVALKVINPGVVVRAAGVQRFQQEARAAARLDHPNIVRAHDADEAGALHFLVMEYVEGTSLAELVGERGPLPVAEACAYARQAALGLQHAHERGMVHRDIKPHNLMLQEGGAAPAGLGQDLGLRLARPPRPHATPAEVAEALARFCPADRARPRKRGRVVVARALLAAGVLAGVAFRHFGPQRGGVVAPTDGTAPRPAVVEKGPEPPLAEKGSRPHPRPPEPPVRGPDGLGVAEAEEKAARTIEKIGGQGERVEPAGPEPVISPQRPSSPAPY